MLTRSRVLVLPLLIGSVLAALACAFDESWARGAAPRSFWALGSLRLYVAIATALMLIMLALSWPRLRDRAPARALDPAWLSIVTGAFLLRLPHLGSLVFNTDECQLVWVASAESLDSMWRLITNFSPHPPGHFALLHFMEILSWQPAWLRLPSLIAGTAVVWLGLKLGTELLGRSGGLALGALLCLSPPLIELSRHARNYAIPLALLLGASLLLVRGLQRHTFKSLFQASLLASLSVLFHYAFLAACIGLGLVAAAHFAMRRASLHEWLRLAWAAMPLALTAGALYLGHVRALPGKVGDSHQSVWGDYVGGGVGAALGTLRDILAHLSPMSFEVALIGLFAIGVVVLVKQRGTLALMLVAGPLLVSYAFSGAGLLPMGATRHSAYLFPFLLIPVAASVRQALRGVSIQRREPMNDAEKSDTARGRVSPVGVGLVALLGAWFLNASAAEYQGYHSGAPPRGVRRQLPVGSLLSESAASFRILREQVEERDLVLLTNGGRYQYLLHHQLTPLVDGATSDDMRLFGSKGMAKRHSPYGTPYYHAPTGFGANFNGLRSALKKVRATYSTRRGDRIWVLFGAREPGVRMLERWCPELKIDRRVAAETGGKLALFDAKGYRECGAGSPPTPKRSAMRASE